MPVPGYDPEDIDDMLETLLTDEEKAEFLTDEEWDTYKNGDESLIDLLDGSEIQRILKKKDAPVDIPD